MRTYPVFLLLMAVSSSAFLGCVSPKPTTSESVEKRSVEVSKELYDALQDDQLAVYNPSNPWPDKFLPQSESYDECAHLAIPFAELDEVFLLKALQVCERRHPTDL